MLKLLLLANPRSKSIFSFCDEFQAGWTFLPRPRIQFLVTWNCTKQRHPGNNACLYQKVISAHLERQASAFYGKTESFKKRSCSNYLWLTVAKISFHWCNSPNKVLWKSSQMFSCDIWQHKNQPSSKIRGVLITHFHFPLSEQGHKLVPKYCRKSVKIFASCSARTLLRWEDKALLFF